MMKKPKVSIVIPVYNAETTISTAVQSILQNDYPNLEIILIDDGSSDKSLQICQKLSKHFSEQPPIRTSKQSTKHSSVKSSITKSTTNHLTRKIKVFHQSNQGASSARNLGLQKSSGELICFVDADDEIAPTFISTLVNLIQQPRTALASTGMLRRKIDSQRIHPKQKAPIRTTTQNPVPTPQKTDTPQNLYRRSLRPQNPNEPRQDYILWLMLQDGRLYPVANKIFKASIIRQHHLEFNKQLNFAEDTEFVLKYLVYATGDIRFDLKPLYIYNLDRTTGTVGPAARRWKNWQTSYNFVKSWLKNPSPRTYQLLHLLKLRWHISHLLSYFR